VPKFQGSSSAATESAWDRVPLALRLAMAIALPAAGLGASLATLLHQDWIRRSGGVHAFPTLLLSSGLAFTAVALVFSIIVARSLLQTLRRLTRKLADAGDQVGTHSENLSNAGYKLSSGATEAASSLEETASSIEELSSMVKVTAESAREASDLSQACRSSAEEGEKRIQGLISSMQTMAQQSKRIEDITSLIDDVAFQTNLLALTAAVEAARAGEQGKGFAVVADAVRSLALRSAEAAKDIGKLVRETVGSIEAGSSLATDSETALREIVGNVRKVADLNNRIALANQEQANGIEQITQAVNQLDAATQMNAASAEQSAASAADLARQADDLEELVARLSFLAGRADAAEERKPARGPEHFAPADFAQKKAVLGTPRKTAGAPTSVPKSAQAPAPVDGRTEKEPSLAIPLPGDAPATATPGKMQTALPARTSPKPVPARKPARSAAPATTHAPRARPAASLPRSNGPGQSSPTPKQEKSMDARIIPMPLPEHVGSHESSHESSHDVRKKGSQATTSETRKAPTPNKGLTSSADSIFPLPGDPAPGMKATASTREASGARDENVILLEALGGNPKPEADPDELVSPLGARKIAKDPRKKRFSDLSGF
jgi:hypothetical protein